MHIVLSYYLCSAFIGSVEVVNVIGCENSKEKLVFVLTKPIVVSNLEVTSFSWESSKKTSWLR